ncbi:MAG: response regulator, partial [Gammaproteobacteria bacterium]|nr:response regulator [Gammaproteobacteria bacterium]
GSCEACVDAAPQAGGASGGLFDTTDFPPRWHCGTWSDVHGWVHILADLATWTAYMAIPTFLLMLLRKRRDIPFPGVIALFVAFIVCCGLTHLLEAVMFWWPAYRLMGLVKMVTAVVSVVTTIVLVFELPKFFQMRSPQQLELEVVKRTRELELARRDAQAAAEAKARFTASVSHELRTPMTAVLGYTELLAEDDHLTEAQRDCIRVIRNNGEHLLAVIGDVLDLTRSEAGRLPIVTRPEDVVELVHDSVEMLRENARSKGLALSFASSGAPPELMLDAKRCRQIVINLLGNAIKFTDHGTVELRLTAPDCSHIRIDVLDTGIGLGHVKPDQLFKPFVQGDGSRSRRHGGTGLGLYISRALIERMDGSIEAAPRAQGGSRFSVRLPVDPHTDWQDLNGPRSATESVEEQAAAPLRGHVLVVEDDDLLRELLQAILLDFGLTVDQVGNGQEAVEAAGTTRYDAILMDMHMPVMDGRSAARRLRELGHALPIIALSADVVGESIKAHLSAGCSHVLPKPASRAQLHAMLCGCLTGPRLPEQRSGH